MHLDPFGKKRISPKRFQELTRRWRARFVTIPQQHTYWLYKVIDDILKENRVHITGAVEIGTGDGALSLVLGIECYRRSHWKSLLTFDIERLPKCPYDLFEKIGICFVQADCFSEEAIEAIKDYVNSPVFFFCDGGNKVKEFKTFAPMLPPHSIIAVHDWRYELCYDHIRETVEELKLQPVKKEEWCAPPDYILTSFWKVPSNETN